MVGPPNSGKFAGLQMIDPKYRIQGQTTVSKINTFEALKIDTGVRNAIENDILGHLNYKQPSEIQILATKAIQAKRKNPDEFRSFLIAAETGSGKTLAYLAPLLSKLKEQEISDPNWEHLKELPIIRCIVLVPTLELTTQVISTVKRICHIAKLSSFALTPEISPRSISSKLEHRIDVLVANPEKLLATFKTQNSINGHLKYCKWVVVDEADTLMDESFVESTQKVLEATSSSATDLVFCSATIPRRFDKIMTKLYPETTRIVTHSLHKIPRHIDFRVVEVFNPPYLNSKPRALQQALYAIHNDNTESGYLKRVVVFLNHKDEIPSLATFLKEKGYDAVSISSQMTIQERKDLISDFVNPAPLLKHNENNSKVKVLLTTDLLSRGVDMNNIRNVILYDLPYSSVDLIHRAGRTGRMGKRGRVFLFVEKKESRGWVKGLEKVVKKGMVLA
ncbi:uncharacterized protein SAPINGB_P006469 [Magnusiomyces paraingens]|uniref:ATP-dependent RNA helicase n=1 Tax=Magnusiomyces paraingens TaxID=2606893 RepID=A0A5E8C622_9ASCO|nr:uncharacterized protein SAPINGB_P006469 [Saprochaete ingens]VVT58957.1 unnamed protein product [Saprochaete ingens]